MIFNNKTYDILKFVAITFIPALATFVGTVGIIVTVLTALGSFIGALVGLSSASYNKGVN